MTIHYPQWIDEFAKAWHSSIKKMVPADWGPLDQMMLIGGVKGLFIDKLYEAVVEAKKRNISPLEIAKSFTTPSELRSAQFYLVIENMGAYQVRGKNYRKKAREVLDVFHEALNSLMKEDMFAQSKNIVHKPGEIRTIVQNTTWQKGTPDIAKDLGKLYVSTSSFVYSLYQDFFPVISNEQLGPYDVSEYWEKDSILIIKNLPHLKPVELWKKASAFAHSHVQILQVYSNVTFFSDVIGFHVQYKGDIINNLTHWALFVDGKQVIEQVEIEKLTSHFVELTEKHSQVYEKMNSREIKIKILEWLHYECKGLFDLVGMNWRPSQDIIKVIEKKEFPERCIMTDYPDYTTAVTSPDFDIYWLKKLYE